MNGGGGGNSSEELVKGIKHWRYSVCIVSSVFEEQTVDLLFGRSASLTLFGIYLYMHAYAVVLFLKEILSRKSLILSYSKEMTVRRDWWTKVLQFQFLFSQWPYRCHAL